MVSRRATITEGLRQRIVAGLHLGTLHPGERLPSIRDLGAQLRTDPRVVMEAYRQLAAEGLVRLRPRSGVFVQAPLDRDEELLPEVAAWLVDIFMRGLSRGIPPTDLRRRVYACLEAEADLVLTTRFHTAEAQRLGRRLRRPVLLATLHPVFITEVKRMLAEGPVWWVCTDPRFAAKLPRMFPDSSVPPIVLGRHPPDEIPAGDLVYATRRAAERLPSGWRGGRVVTIPRVFSVDTARALLVFLLRRNLQAAQEAARRGHRWRAKGGARPRGDLAPGVGSR